MFPRSALVIVLLLTFSTAVVYAQEQNVGILRIANFQPPRQVAPNDVFPVALDVEYAVHGIENATIRSAIYSGSSIENQTDPLWQSKLVAVNGGGDMIWNVSLTAPANEGEMQLTAVAYYLNGNVWQYFNDSIQGPGYVHLSVKVAQTANLEIDLGEAGLPVTVANSTQQTSTSGNANVMLPVDETYTLSVPANVELKNSTKLIFSGWSDGNNDTTRSVRLDGDVIVVGSYRHQFLVQVNSIVSAYSYSNWYDAESNVTLHAESSIPLSSPLNLLGLKYDFGGWTGDVNSQSTQVNVTMNSPKSINANFSVDYSPLVVPAILIIGIVGAVILVILRRKRSVMDVTPSEAPESASEAEPDQKTESLLCGSCGKTVESEWKHCIYCGADLPGPRPIN
jgi:hypothetical protein